LNIGGYAITFNTVSVRGGVREVVKPGAFAQVIAERSGLYLLRNHSVGQPSFASTGDGTLHLEEDGHGLYFEAQLANDAAGARLLGQVCRRQVCEVSIGSLWDLSEVDNGIRVFYEIGMWEISLAEPGRAGCVGTWVRPIMEARRDRLRAWRLAS
jgi:HK97 family phage prohead protease